MKWVLDMIFQVRSRLFQGMKCTISFSESFQRESGVVYRPLMTVFSEEGELVPNILEVSDRAVMIPCDNRYDSSWKGCF